MKTQEDNRPSSRSSYSNEDDVVESIQSSPIKPNNRGESP